MIILFGIGGFEILLVFLVVLLLFGSKQLPEVARFLGKGWGTMKRTTEEIRQEFEAHAKSIEKGTKNITEDEEKEEKNS